MKALLSYISSLFAIGLLASGGALLCGLMLVFAPVIALFCIDSK